MNRMWITTRMKYRIGRSIVFKRASRRRMQLLENLILKRKARFPRMFPSRSGFLPNLPISETLRDLAAPMPSISGWGLRAGPFHITRVMPRERLIYKDEEAAEQASPPASGPSQPSGRTSGTGQTGSSQMSGPRSEDDVQVDAIRRYLAQKLGFHEPDTGEDTPAPERVLQELTLEGVVKWMKGERCKNVITLAGAGISTSAGIPDFRSPVSGLYHNLQKYELPEPQAIFEINFFRQNPKPFFALAKELFPGNFKPTASHYFIRLLHEKGLLLRHYTQNIDTLERGAGLPAEKLVEAHGTFYTSHCLQCRKEYDLAFIKEHIFSERIPICSECPGVVKPDIVFFGESLPGRFQQCLQADFSRCDMLIIMGSSLEVQPFASLIDMVPDWCPRLLINRERAGQRSSIMRLLGLSGGGLQLDPAEATRDVMLQGDCDDGCQELADKLGWGEELRALVASEHERLEREGAASAPHAPVSPVPAPAAAPTAPPRTPPGH